MNGKLDAGRPTPPDPEKMNDSRAEWAAASLRHFQSCTGADFDDALSDLLCDLMHWSDRNGFDFDGQLTRARTHYEAETSRSIDLMADALNIIASGKAEPDEMVKIAIDALEMAPSAWAKIDNRGELFGEISQAPTWKQPELSGEGMRADKWTGEAGAEQSPALSQGGGGQKR
jgi:hypothetical protein